jgi:SAM-dependent methyltransferase
MPAEPNAYSREWFEFFHAEISEERTGIETAFVSACAPLPEFRTVADVCCGMGRHARALSSLGYDVTGIERDAHAIARAREHGGGPAYVQADLREWSPQPGAFDAAIVMSQSFGYFDAQTNSNVLRQLAVGVRDGGRIILDFWNPEFFPAHQGEREFDLPRGRVRERKQIEGDRLFVQLSYPGGVEDEFEWQLFSPAEMTRLAASAGLELLLVCTDFDQRTRAAPDKPRLQFVLERRS